MAYLGTNSERFAIEVSQLTHFPPVAKHHKLAFVERFKNNVERFKNTEAPLTVWVSCYMHKAHSNELTKPGLSLLILMFLFSSY